MPVVILGRGKPVQVDFPENVQRSAKGALHLLPSGSREITPEELEHIRKVHPDIFKRLQVQSVAEPLLVPVIPAVEVFQIAQAEHKAEGKKSGAKNRE